MKEILLWIFIILLWLHRIFEITKEQKENARKQNISILEQLKQSAPVALASLILGCIITFLIWIFESK